MPATIPPKAKERAANLPDMTSDFAVTCNGINSIRDSIKEDRMPPRDNVIFVKDYLMTQSQVLVTLALEIGNILVDAEEAKMNEEAGA